MRERLIHQSREVAAILPQEIHHFQVISLHGGLHKRIAAARYDDTSFEDLRGRFAVARCDRLC